MTILDGSRTFRSRQAKEAALRISQLTGNIYQANLRAPFRCLLISSRQRIDLRGLRSGMEADGGRESRYY